MKIRRREFIAATAGALAGLSFTSIAQRKAYEGETASEIITNCRLTVSHFFLCDNRSNERSSA